MCQRWVPVLLISGAVIASSGHASISGMTLAERVKVADFIGVVRIQSVHDVQNPGQVDENGPIWFHHTADALVSETIKGAHIPSHITIQFDNGQGQAPPNVVYVPNAEYLVFVAYEPGGVFSTCVEGQFAISNGAISGWPGSSGPLTLDAVRTAITELLPRKPDA